MGSDTRRQLEEALREREHRLALVTDNVPAMIAYLDAGRRFRYANLRYRLFYGGSEAAIEGKALAEVLTPEALRAAMPGVARALAGEAVSVGGERRLHDGSLRHVAVSLVPHRDEASGAVLGIYILVLDVTAQRQAEAALRESEAGLRHAQDMAALAHVVVRPDGSYERWSENWPRLMAIDLARVPRSTRESLPLVHAEDRERFRAAAIEAARTRHRTVIEYRFQRGDGVLIHVRQIMEPLAVRGDAAPHWFVTIQDVSEQKRIEERIRDLAYYDSLTGLANRALFLERLGERVAAAARDGQRLALLILNIDRFKNINETLGRPAGDALLKEFARRLQLSAHDASLVARVGSDQFAVLLLDVKSEESLRWRLEHGDARVKATPFLVAGTELRIATRSGVAVFPQDGTDVDSLLHNAEAALKQAATGDMYVFYRREMSERVAEKLSLENRLRTALEKSQFVLHYQPKLDLATRRITGAEALVRWASPELGLVPPERFIPLLEETGLILPVGAWAIAQAAADQRRWRARGLPAPRLAVNVSAIQLRQRDFVVRVKEALGEGGAPGVDLEITESLVMEDIDANVEKLKAVRALGVEITLDDFGTGYSSLSYLARLPVQALKIDRSFTAAMAHNPDTMTLVSTIVSLAHSLRLKVIAEGVETEVQEGLLRGMRCDEAQGFLYARPMPADELEARLAARA